MVETHWEYRPGFLNDGRAFVSGSVIAPEYVTQFMAEGGEVIRRRVGPWETVTSSVEHVEP